MDLKGKMDNLREIYKLLYKTPLIRISLMLSSTEGNDPFFRDITVKFYKLVTRRRRKIPIFRQMTRAVGVCLLPDNHADYIKGIESSGHRNVKKAIKNGYTFRRIDLNLYLDSVWEIRRSTPTRQGKLADSFLNNKPGKISDPQSKSKYHDYPYFGIFSADDMLVAYAGCFLAGEVIELSHFYGHADHQKNGVVPLLITSIAKYAIENHPSVKTFVYGGYIGASPSLKRFKKKFNFLPHRIIWSLD